MQKLIKINSIGLFCRCFDTFLECKVHESEENTMYQCAICEDKFDSLDKLTEHETEHKENKQEQRVETRKSSRRGVYNINKQRIL